MPPHLHPRSRSTTSLFTVTLLASFFIVGVPHLFPCPAPRKAFADSDMAMTADGQPQRIRRRRRKTQDQSDQADATATTTESDVTRELAVEAAEFRHMEEEAKRLAKLNRECPIPKPGGVIGTILGFDHDSHVSVAPSNPPGRNGER